MRIRVKILADVMHSGEHFHRRTVAAHARECRIHAEQLAIHGRLKNSFHRVLEQKAEFFLGLLLGALSFAALCDVLVNSVATNRLAFLAQRHAGDLHVNERSIAATTAGTRAEHFARGGAFAEPQRFTLVLAGRQQHIKLGAENFGLAVLEEIFERGIAHANPAIQVEDDHRLRMAGEQ